MHIGPYKLKNNLIVAPMAGVTDRPFRQLCKKMGAGMAVSEMVELLSKRYGYAPVDAYMLCSVCADLRISSIVDVPNWVVSFYFPRIVLE